MTQNLIDLVFTDAQLDAIDGALDILDANFDGLIALAAVQRRRIYKMGSNSEPFCRQAVMVLAQNPQIVPPTLDVEQAQADLVALEQLRTRSIRLKRLMERIDDSEMALGSDVLAVARTGYKLIQVVGAQHGLGPALRELEPRFQRAGRSRPDPGEAE
jgi:hypothetical protein